MGNLSLTLLGPPQVRHGDQLLLFSTRKELALILSLTSSSNVTPWVWISPPRSSSTCICSTQPGGFRARRQARR